MELARSADGLVIHRDTCRYAGPTNHWYWADGKDRAQVAFVVALFGYRQCRVCKPDLIKEDR